MDYEAAGIGRDLTALNESFLLLLSDGTDMGLPSLVTARLQCLCRGSRQRLAAVPFALFSFGFEDGPAWVRLLSPGVRELQPEGPLPSPAAERFSLLVLTCIRSLVQVSPCRIAAWAGLPADTRTRLAGLEIATLRFVAPLAAAQLRGRFPPREGLWLRLAEACERNDSRQIAILGALGMQLTIRRALGLGAQQGSGRGFRR